MRRGKERRISIDIVQEGKLGRGRIGLGRGKIGQGRGRGDVIWIRGELRGV